MAHILAVDDDDDVLDSIREIFEGTNISVIVASSGQEALALLRKAYFDLVVLDIIMPDIDGIEVCRRIRADPSLSRIPILFLTAKARSSDVARGLDVGGDDYLVKPYDIIELPARVRALLRRAPGGMLDSSEDAIRFGQITLHYNRWEVELGENKTITLTPTEHKLLYYLMSHGGQPVAADQLLQDVWEYPSGVGDPQLVRVHVNNLRNKFQTAGYDCVETLHGKGYLIKT